MINANSVISANNVNNTTTDNKENKMNTTTTTTETNNTLSLTIEQQEKLVQLAKMLNKSIIETFEQVVDRGLYDVKYRTERNRREYNAYKEWKRSQK